MANSRGVPKKLPRLLLVGAGRTEIGRPQRNDPGEDDLRGAVLHHLLDQLLVHRTGRLFADGRGYQVAQTMKFDDIPRMIKGKSKTLPSLDAEKVRRALFLAEQRNLDGVVVLIDRERKDHPDRAARMREGRDQYREAGGGSPGCAVGAACRSVETWLLADSQAVRAVFGDQAKSPFGKDPEDRPSPRELKQYIVQQSAQNHITVHQAREELAGRARPDELKMRCPTGYPPFADDVIAEIGPLVPPN